MSVLFNNINELMLFSFPENAVREARGKHATGSGKMKKPPSCPGGPLKRNEPQLVAPALSPGPIPSYCSARPGLFDSAASGVLGGSDCEGAAVGSEAARA